MAITHHRECSHHRRTGNNYANHTITGNKKTQSRVTEIGLRPLIYVTLIKIGQSINSPSSLISLDTTHHTRTTHSAVAMQHRRVSSWLAARSKALIFTPPPHPVVAATSKPSHRHIEHCRTSLSKLAVSWQLI